MVISTHMANRYTGKSYSIERLHSAANSRLPPVNDSDALISSYERPLSGHRKTVSIVEAVLPS